MSKNHVCIVSKKDVIELTNQTRYKIVRIKGEKPFENIPENKLLVLDGNFVYELPNKPNSVIDKYELQTIELTTIIDDKLLADYEKFLRSGRNSYLVEDSYIAYLRENYIGKQLSEMLKPYVIDEFNDWWLKN